MRAPARDDRSPDPRVCVPHFPHAGSRRELGGVNPSARPDSERVCEHSGVEGSKAHGPENGPCEFPNQSVENIDSDP